MEYFILIGANGIQAWRSTRNGMERAARFDDDDPEAPARLRSWLAGTRRRCILVADLADERYLIEQLPRVSRADQRLLIDRRLAQYFPDTSLTCASPQPSAPEDGLSRPMLLAALTRPAHIAPWLEILGEAGSSGLLEVRGALTSVPFLLEGWYRRQRALPEQSLLLATGAGGMRQIFFRQRRLAFSRVIPARGGSLADSLPNYRNELAQTLAWLPSQRLSDGPPPVRVLATEEELPILREIASAASGDIEFIDLARHMSANANANTGNSATPAVSVLALQEARRAASFGHYNCPQLRRARQLAGARQIMFALGIVFTISGLGAAALDFTAATHLHDEADQLITRQKSLQGEIDKLDADAAQMPDADEFAAWLDASEHIVHATGIAPATVLQAVAGLLAEAPWARLETLAWERTPSGHTPVLLPEFAAKDLPAGDTASASTIIALEISLDDKAPPPQAAAANLSAHWQRLNGSPMQAQPGTDANPALLQLRASLPQVDAMASSLQTSAQ